MQYCGLLERHRDFAGKRHVEFLWTCGLAAGFLLLLAALTGSYFLGHSLVFTLLYIWSYKEAGVSLNFWGFRVKGSQLPFVLAVLHVVMGGDWAEDAAALLAGHVVYFCEAVLPREVGWRPLRIPQWLRQRWGLD